MALHVSRATSRYAVFGLVGAIVLVMSLFACGVDVCPAGKVERCPCADGSNGVQRCMPRGVGWGACDCRGPGLVLADGGIVSDGAAGSDGGSGQVDGAGGADGVGGPDAAGGSEFMLSDRVPTPPDASGPKDTAPVDRGGPDQKPQDRTAPDQPTSDQMPLDRRPPPTPTGSSNEEFVGPFKSWKNVKDFGAKGDGKSDDTAAIQLALKKMETLGKDEEYYKKWQVLYFPAGTYVIKKTLTSPKYKGISIIGYHPATTILRWEGPAGGEMMRLDAGYSKISRLTFDGRKSAGIGLGRGHHFSTFFEMSDLVFKDMKTCTLLGDQKTQPQAEHFIVRTHFLRCSEEAIRIQNFNSLDIQVWYSKFEDCKYGIRNWTGNVNVYKSVFLRSTVVDIWNNVSRFYNYVKNVSVGSKAFFDKGDQVHRSGSMIWMQGNQIWGYKGERAIAVGDAGPYTLVDNLAVPDSPKPKAPFYFSAKENISIGNRSIQSPVVEVKQGLYMKQPRRFKEIGSKVVTRASLGKPDTSIPPTPPNRKRKIFEVKKGTGDDARAIQDQIDAAAKEPYGTRPVVHLPPGNYSITRTIVVPANKDIQIIGDSVLWSVLGGSADPIMRVEGPSHAVLRSFKISANNGLVVTNADQPGGRIYAEQLLGKGVITNNTAAKQMFLINGIEQADFLCIACGFGQTDLGVNVVGGPQRASRKTTPGQVSFISGSSGNAAELFRVEKGGELLANAYWYEGHWRDGKSNTGLHLRSYGKMTLVGMRWAFQGDKNLSPLLLDGFKGVFTSLSNKFRMLNGRSAWFELRGSGAGLDVLIAGNTFNVESSSNQRIGTSYVWRDKTSPAANAATLQCFLSGSKKGAIYTDEIFGGVDNIVNKKKGTPSDAKILKAYAPMRNVRLGLPQKGKIGTTNLQMFRVWVDARGGATAFEFSR